MKKYLVGAVVLLTAMSLFAGGNKENTQPATGSSTNQQTQTAATTIKNPDTFIFATYGDAQTLDPATEYDTSSATILKNIYEGLIKYSKDDVGTFVPVLATEVPTVENGGISNAGKTYTFTIRKGVTFQNGDPMTPEDVAYSIKRDLVIDQDAGPTWMFYTALLGMDGSRDSKGNIVVTWDQINNAITVNGDKVTFHLKQAFAPFLSIMANTFGVIVDKKWVIANGGWDGTAATWKKYNNPPQNKETLSNIAMGTGPYKLTRWDKGNEIVLDRYDGYWGKKPAMKEGIYKIVSEWSTRKLMLVQGDADAVAVDPTYYAEMDKEPGLSVQKNEPSLDVTAMFFNFNTVTKDNPYVGSGKLDGNGVPANFFQDKNVRLGFLAAWDEKTYLQQGLAGNGTDPVTPVPRGLPYKDMALTRTPTFSLQKSADYFKKAWGGQVWAKGFKMQIFYNTGNSSREIAAKMLAENLQQVNSKFQVEVSAVEWPQYLNAYRNRTLPIFIIGWAPDYPDPDNYVVPFILSTGSYAGKQSYKNPEADALIKAAGFETDPAKRKADYYKIQQIYLNDAPGSAILQPTRNYYWKDWVHGYSYNPMQQTLFDWLPYITKSAK